MNLKAITALLIAGAFATQSCSTLFSTPYQSVKTNPFPADAKVSLNDKPVGENLKKVAVKRSKGGELKFEKEGYKSHIEMLFPAGVDPLYWLDAITLVGSMVDLVSGSYMTLNKNEVSPKLIKIPAKADGSETVACSNVNIKFKAGDKLGNTYLKDQPMDILYFDKTLDINASDLQDNVNNSLKELGFTTVKTGDGSLFSAQSEAQYLFSAEVKEIKYDIIKPALLATQLEARCKVTVTWKLENRYNEVKFEKVTTGESVKSNGGTAVFYDAFENSLYELLYNPEIYALVKKSEGKSLTEQFARLTLPKPKKATSGNSINNATKSVVTIQTTNGHGSGCVISSNGYIVTNYHVVNGVNKVNVNFEGGLSLEGEVVRANRDFDLALIKVGGNGFNALTLSPEKEIEMGSDVYAIGTPADRELGQTVTKGIISSQRTLQDKKYIQTDVSINPGSSGGALLNKDGILIGVVNAKVVGKGMEGIGFAIPAYEVSDKLNISFQ